MKKVLSFTARLVILGTVFVAGSSSAADLTVYSDFAEVREKVQFQNSRFEWMPPADLNEFIIPGSLDLEHPSVSSMRLLPPSESFLKTFEGKMVKVYWAYAEDFVDARVIRADLNLFEIDGDFVRIDEPRVKYPSLDGVRFSPTYSWELLSESGTAALVYATRGLSWSKTRYTLNLPKSGDSQLTAWADMRNDSSLDYTAQKVTFLAGDVTLEPQGEYLPQAIPVRRVVPSIAPMRPVATKPASTATISMPAPSRVSSIGELGGLRSYQYNNPVKLLAKTTTGLPFIKAALKVKDVLEYRVGFDTEPRSVASLQRLFAFTTDQSLPEGSVIVREDGKLIGQEGIANTPAQGNVRLNLGKDFDTKMIRSVQVIERTKKLKRFRVTYSLKNLKTRAINVRISEYIPSNSTLVNPQLPELSGRPDAIFSSFTLPAGETFNGSYELNFKLK
jgi:hypothetical protein